MADGNEIGLEHLLAGAIRANGGELVFPVEDILAEDNFDKQISLVVEDGIATITLVDGEVTE